MVHGFQKTIMFIGKFYYKIAKTEIIETEIKVKSLSCYKLVIETDWEIWDNDIFYPKNSIEKMFF